jgi:AAA domain (dynein-related subfamily)
MSDTDINPFDARWLNCLYGGKLSGRTTFTTDTFIFIEPLLDITLQDGSKSRKFFALRRNCKAQSLQKDDYVIFEWERVGERSYDRKRDGQGEPEAVEIEIVSKEVAEEIARKFRGLLPKALREKWNEFLSVLEQKEQTINLQVEELARSRITELQREVDLEIERLSEQEVVLQHKNKELDIRTKELKQQQNLLTEKEQNFTELAKELEPYMLALPIKKKKLQVGSQDYEFLPNKLGENWQKQLQMDGLQVPKNVANSFLLSLLSGFYSGGLVLLNGSVGVGKTSIVKHSAKLLGGSYEIIPVRPAWIEPADLLGFFDPIHEIFRPTSFLTALKKAEEDREKLHLICLDELNLAKIENYASDLLSKLEYSREPENLSENSLLLFSEDIETELWHEVKYLNEQVDLDPKQRARLKRLQMFLSNQRSRQTIPGNLVLLGTLNSDETTYDLSPKVIDRSFTITYPIADFDHFSRQNINQESSSRSSLSVSKLRRVLKEGYLKNLDLLDNPKSDGWAKIRQWQTQYFSEASSLGVPLGYRARNEYAVFCSVANWLGLDSQETFSHFLFAKILPRIYFFKEDRSNNLFRKWLGELKQSHQKYDPASILDKLERQLNDDRRQTVRYWG